MKLPKLSNGWNVQDAGREVMASVVVFLVALPLCMGIAIASGVPPAAGLITGIVGGLLVGFLAGAPLQVSGPAAGLTVIVWQLVQQHGIAVLAPIVLAAGAIQLAAGLLKTGQWFRAISPAVIYGMLAGIGILIFASQFHIMVDGKTAGSGLLNLLNIPRSIYDGVFPIDGNSQHIAAVIGLLTITMLVLWPKLRPRQLKMLPGALVAVGFTTILANAMNLPIQYVKVPSDLLSSLSLPDASAFAILLRTDVLGAVLGLAFIASAETLLTVSAVDKMHSGQRANYDRELAAQGVGNMVCGLLGALPMTGVIVRSGANVEAGAKTRASAILHGGWLLAPVVFLPEILSMIPTSALAAILVYTGYKLVKPNEVRTLARFGKGEVLIYAATVLGIVGLDLLTGVVIGFALAVGKLLYTFTHLDVRTVENGPDGRVDVYLDGAATFVGLPKLARALEAVPSGREVHVHIDHLSYIDHACMDLMHGWKQQHEATGNTLVLEWEELASRIRPLRNGEAEAGAPVPALSEGLSQAAAAGAGAQPLPAAASLFSASMNHPSK